MAEYSKAIQKGKLDRVNRRKDFWDLLYITTTTTTTTTNFINKKIILQKRCPQLARLLEAGQ